MKPGGLLFITATPAGDAFAFDVYREKWHLFNPLEHLHFFSLKHLTKILDELDIPHIEMLHELPKHMDFSEIYDRYFVKRENGSLGHPSAIQHQRMAEIIYEKICSLPGPNKPGC